MDKATSTIICIAHAAGRRHDFRLFKQSQVRFHPDTKAITDTGYMGLQKLHGHTILPKKHRKKHPLHKQDKWDNHPISETAFRQNTSLAP